MILTKNQIAIMKHTVSDPNRNWFGTSYGCQDSDDFEELIKLGLADKRPAPSYCGDEIVYFLTGKGQEFIKSKKQ